MRTKVSINFKRRIYQIEAYDKIKKQEIQTQVVVHDFIQNIKNEKDWDIALKDELRKTTGGTQVHINTINYNEDKERISVSRQKFIDMYYEGYFDET